MNADTLQHIPKGAVLCVVGARPNFMKIAPIMRAFSRETIGVPAALVHTGQHYDEAMKHFFFNQLGIPEPDVDLEVGSASHAVQTAQIMLRFEPVVDAVQPSAVLVVGDVNSTIACALVAAKKSVPVVHVEAGLRSYDRDMPEEINRVLTDQISDLLYTTERSAQENLQREGIAPEKVEFVGNVMIDTLHHQRKNAVPAEDTIKQHAGEASVQLCRSGYGVLTMHRPSNVDDAKVLKNILETLVEVSSRLPLIFAVHPRTRAAIQRFELEPLLAGAKNILRVPALGYLEMLGLMAKAKLVLTDSGGIQEETTALGVPCITMRENTERPITVEQGTNTIVGRDSQKIMKAVEDIMRSGGKAGRIPELWDGKAAQRIASHLGEWLKQRVQN